MLMPFGIASAALSKLIAPALCLTSYASIILKRHIRLLDVKAALIAADARLYAQPRFSVDAMTHNANVDKVREGRHKRVDACILSVLIEYARTDICARLRIKCGSKPVFFIFDYIAQSTFLLSEDSPNSMVQHKVSKFRRFQLGMLSYSSSADDKASQ